MWPFAKYIIIICEHTHTRLGNHSTLFPGDTLRLVTWAWTLSTSGWGIWADSTLSGTCEKTLQVIGPVGEDSFLLGFTRLHTSVISVPLILFYSVNQKNQQGHQKNWPLLASGWVWPHSHAQCQRRTCRGMVNLVFKNSQNCFVIPLRTVQWHRHGGHVVIVVVDGWHGVVEGWNN